MNWPYCAAWQASEVLSNRYQDEGLKGQEEAVHGLGFHVGDRSSSGKSRVLGDFFVGKVRTGLADQEFELLNEKDRKVSGKDEEEDEVMNREVL